MRAVPSERLQTSLNTGWENDSTRKRLPAGGDAALRKTGPALADTHTACVHQHNQQASTSGLGRLHGISSRRQQ